jgi:transposase-like protein
MSKAKSDAAKERYWQKTIHEAVCSGASIREFCRRRRLNEHQFYWWRHRLEEARQRRALARPDSASGPASFALVSEEGAGPDAGLELVLDGGRRLRISKGVDEQALRTVLAALERQRC